jgi:hypothetical protein
LTPSCANAFSRPPSIHPAEQIAKVAFDLGKREREGRRQAPHGRASSMLASDTLSETALALMIHAEPLLAWTTGYTVVFPVHMASVTTRGQHDEIQEPQLRRILYDRN